MMNTNSDNHGYVKMVDFGFSKRMEVNQDKFDKFTNWTISVTLYYRMGARPGHFVELLNMLRLKSF